MGRDTAYKTCPDCKLTKPAGEFHNLKRSKDSLYFYCKACTSIRQRDYHSAISPERRAERNTTVARSRARLREEAVARYGGKCRCCGEDRIVFLTIEHPNDDGNQERLESKTKGGTHFYSWLRRRGWPEGYEVLCFNCQIAWHRLGTCPHQEDERKEQQ